MWILSSFLNWKSVILEKCVIVAIVDFKDDTTGHNFRNQTETLIVCCNQLVLRQHVELVMVAVVYFKSFLWLF